MESQSSISNTNRKLNEKINDDNNNFGEINYDINSNVTTGDKQAKRTSLDKTLLPGEPRLIKLKNGQEFFELDRYGKGGIYLSPLIINLCTFVYSLVPLGSCVSGIVIVWLLFTNYWYLTLFYVLYLIVNLPARDTGGHRIDSNFDSIFWKYLAAYFTIKLRYSTKFQLNPEENYLLNYCPHGISGFGAVCAFATNALNFTHLFAGIKPRFMVHETVFLTPFMREFFAYRGDCSVSSKSIDFMLDPITNGTGNLLCLVAGGLQEADLSHPTDLKVVVMKRKGFIKKALINGANLIPAIGFGENSVFDKINVKAPSPLYYMEKFSYKYLGFKHPIYWGLGTMPFKKQITVVLGDPINVGKSINPSQQQIDELHELYVTELKRIYESHEDLRTKYDTKLILV